jgi:hypothetical protein
MRGYVRVEVAVRRIEGVCPLPSPRNRLGAIFTGIVGEEGSLATVACSGHARGEAVVWSTGIAW